MSRDRVIDKFKIAVGCDMDIQQAKIRKFGQELAADAEFALQFVQLLTMKG